MAVQMTDEDRETRALQDVLRLTRRWCAELDESSPLAEDLAKLGGAAMKALDLRVRGREWEPLG